MPKINWVIRVMKEMELETAPQAWQSACYSFEYTNYMAQFDPANNGITMPTNTGKNPTDLDEIVLLKNKIMIPAFETAVLHCRMKRTMMMGCKLHIMTQAMYLEDRVNLPNGVYMVKTYTELHNSSCNISVVLRNLTGKPVHLAAGQAVVRVVAANAIPDETPSLEFLEKLDEMELLWDPPKKLTVEERQKLLLEVLQKEDRLDKLKEWLPKLALKFERMLMEHHNIFSLDKNEIGCTDAAEHVIELLDTKPFKERFWWMVFAVVLVRKKDRGLRFCIDFRKLNNQTKKDAFPLPRMQETMESMVGARFFSTMDLKSGFWQVKMAKKSQQYTTFTVGRMGVYEFLRMPYRLCNAPATFQRLMQNCLVELNLTYALIYLDNVIVFSRTEEDHLHHLRVVFSRFFGTWSETKTVEMSLSAIQGNILRS